jgi:hypothetical protein
VSHRTSQGRQAQRCYFGKTSGQKLALQEHVTDT